MISPTELKPLQSLALTMLLKERRLLLCLPRQEGKTELGVRVHRSIQEDGVRSRQTRQGLFLAKSHAAAKKAAREKFKRLFDKTLYNVNTESVVPKKHDQSAIFIDSVDKDTDRIRGGTNHFVHWSEIAFSRFEHGVTAIDVVDKVIKPSLKETNGYFLGESTTNGKNGF